MSEREEMFIENIKKVAKKYNLNPKIIHMTIAFQEYMFRWDMFESGDYKENKNVQTYLNNDKTLNIVYVYGESEGKKKTKQDHLDMNVYEHFNNIFANKEQMMVSEKGIVLKSEWPPLFMSHEVIDEFKKLRDIRKKALKTN